MVLLDHMLFYKKPSSRPMLKVSNVWPHFSSKSFFKVSKFTKVNQDLFKHIN